MKRIFIFVFVFTVLFSSVITVVSAEEEAKNADRFAVIDIDSGAIGSSINYFVLRPVMEYDDIEGVAEGTMFSGIIFSVSNQPENANKAEEIITILFKDGTCISAADTVAGEMKEDGFLAEESKYPVYVTVPYMDAVFNTEEEKTGFCKYYIDTLVSVFESKEYKNVALAGVYLSTYYDAAPSLRGFCINTAKEKGLLCVASSAIGGKIDGAKVFAANKKIEDQLAMDHEGKGYTLTLSGVPDDSSADPYNSLVSDYNALKAKGIGKADLMFKFRAYNDVYDCASAIENAVPNPKARSAYELLKEITDCSFDKNDAVFDEETSWDAPWLYWGSAALAVVGTLGICYLVYALVKKGKSDG